MSFSPPVKKLMKFSQFTTRLKRFLITVHDQEHTTNSGVVLKTDVGVSSAFGYTVERRHCSFVSWLTKEPNCGETIMDFPIMTPATIADHARELFKKSTGYENKTMKKLFHYCYH
jgi:hypothetical protein